MFNLFKKKEIFIKKYWDEEGILFYLHFQDGKALRQIEETSTGKVYLTSENSVKGASMLFDQDLKDLDLEKKDFITKEEFEETWNKKLKILGVYKVEDCTNVHLIEIQYRGDSIDIDKFTQEIESEDKSNWQVIYDEQFLNEEGTEIIATPTKGTIRVVFFFHYLNFNKFLITPEGDQKLPNETKMPERLEKIIRYKKVN